VELTGTGMDVTFNNVGQPVVIGTVEAIGGVNTTNGTVTLTFEIILPPPPPVVVDPETGEVTPPSPPVTGDPDPPPFFGNVILDIPEGEPIFLPSLSGVTQAVTLASQGGHIIVPTNLNATVNLTSLAPLDLPAELPGSDTFITSLNIGLELGETDGPPGETVILASFDIPDDMLGAPIEVLFWNPDINNGAGGWEALQDIVVTDDGRVEAMVNAGGTYVLAACDPAAGCAGQQLASGNGDIPVTGDGDAGPGIVVDVTPGQQFDLNTVGDEPVILSLGDSGQTVTVVVSVEGGISLDPQEEVSLPADVPPNTNYLSGLEVNLSGSNGGGVLGAGGLVLATLDIPEDATGNLAVLTWNPLLNGGAGGWVEVPNTQINANGQVEFPVLFGGTYILVSD